MADQTPSTEPRASVRWARLLGLPEPAPWTEEQQATYRRKMDQANAQLETIIARRQQSAA